MQPHLMKPFFFQEHCSSPKSSCVKVYFRSAHFHVFYILWQNPSKQINSYLRCPGLTSLMSRNDASKKISKFLAANYFPGGSGDHVTFSMLVQGSQKCPREYLHDHEKVSEKQQLLHPEKWTSIHDSFLRKIPKNFEEGIRGISRKSCFLPL